jgi:polar amino acid transport system substrate-binding protein
MKFHLLVMPLLLSFLGLAQGSELKKNRSAAVSTVDIENPGLVASTEIMTEVYSRLGIHLSVVRLPAQRALPEANSGKYDGELYRVAAVAKDFPKLRRVPTSIGAIEFMAYGKKGTTIKLTDWQSLKPYKLGAQLGIKYIEYNTKGMNINFVSRGEQLIHLLHHHRIDLILIDKNTMLETEKRMRGTKDRELLGEIQEVKMMEAQPLYHYVHLKNEALIPEIDAMIQTLKKEGFLKKCWDNASL